MLQPLAERLRPKNLDEYIGQEHLVGPGAVLRRMIDSGKISSFILWGPPGVGKTTLAHIISQQLQAPFFTLSAVQSGVKEVREVLDRCKSNIFSKVRPILFIDEIHRFSKSQQDSLLGAVEYGTVTLIGATTENPSFEVIRPLLSRCQVYVLKSLEVKHLQQLLDRAIHTDTYLKTRNFDVRETDALFEQGRAFIDALPASQLHVFTYSERAGTRMLQMPHPVPVPERRRRNEILQAISRQKHHAFCESQIGRPARVLWEGRRRADRMAGFTENYVRVEAPYRPRLINTIQPVTLGGWNDDHTALTIES